MLYEYVITSYSIHYTKLYEAGIVIGRKGSEIEALKAKLELLTGKKATIKVQEVKQFNKDAVLVAENIATSIERRVAYKRAVNQAIMRAERAGALGIKVMVSGRLNGAEIARSEWSVSGKVPLHTLRADIEYATATARTTVITSYSIHYTKLYEVIVTKEALKAIEEVLA